jgi:D-glycero-beta-D-manno-heptose-7-phosphate kinase
MLNTPHLKLRPYKVLIIGDVMLDAHHYGRSDRQSAEAAINVFDIEKTIYNPGGAANVAVNVKAMGGRPVLMGVVGKDEYAEILIQQLKKAEIGTDMLVTLRHLPTTLKSRYYIENKQVFRADRESKEALSITAARHQFLHTAVHFLHHEHPDVVILQDYNKGVLHPDLSHALIQQAKALNIPVIVDPKIDHIYAYRGARLLKPNLQEWFQLSGDRHPVSKEDFDRVAKRIMEDLRLKELIVTLSEQGLYYNDGMHSEMLPGIKVYQPDVSGAGDSVIAAIAMSIAQGWNAHTTAEMGNIAGAAACMKRGVKAITLSDMKALLG